MNNFADVNPKFFNSSDFPFKLFFLKITSVLYFLLESLSITRSLRLILWHASRSPAEKGVPVRDKALHIDSSSYISWISSGTRFISIISFLRYCEKSKAFLCNVSICLERSFMQFFETSSSDSTRAYFSRNSPNLEVRFTRFSWIEFTVSNSFTSSSLLSFSYCFLVRTTIFKGIRQ